jgi:hypothetical protein
VQAFADSLHLSLDVTMFLKDSPRTTTSLDDDNFSMRGTHQLLPSAKVTSNNQRHKRKEKPFLSTAIVLKSFWIEQSSES